MVGGRLEDGSLDRSTDAERLSDPRGDSGRSRRPGPTAAGAVNGYAGGPSTVREPAMTRLPHGGTLVVPMTGLVEQYWPSGLAHITRRVTLLTSSPGEVPYGRMAVIRRR
jgi:hypothetical protein